MPGAVQVEGAAAGKIAITVEGPARRPAPRSFRYVAAGAAADGAAAAGAAAGGAVDAGGAAAAGGTVEVVPTSATRIARIKRTCLRAWPASKGDAGLDEFGSAAQRLICRRAAKENETIKWRCKSSGALVLGEQSGNPRRKIHLPAATVCGTASAMIVEIT